MAVFHPLKHTHWLAGIEGLRREEREKTDGEDSRRSASPQTHSNSSHPYLSVSRRSLCRHRQGALREQVEVVYSHAFFFLFSLSPWCSCAHISLYHTHTDRVRLKQPAGDTARILPRLHRHQRGDLSFHFVAVSIRMADRKEATATAGAERRHQSLLIKATPQEYFKTQLGLSA